MDSQALEDAPGWRGADLLLTGFQTDLAGGGWGQDALPLNLMGDKRRGAMAWCPL